MARANRARIAELVDQGMSPRTAGRQERAERAGFATYGEHEYAQRKARAERLGYSGFKEGQRARAEARATGDTAKLKGGDRPGGSPRRQVFNLGGGRVVVKTRPGDPRASIGPVNTAIRNAGRGKSIKFVVTTTDGRSVTIYDKGGRSAAGVRAAIDNDHDGDVLDYIGDEMGDIYGDAYSGGAAGIASVQVVIG